MGKFRNKAQDSLSLSNVMTDRKAMTTDEIANKYPDYVTIVDFDVIRGRKGEYPVFLIEQDPGVYFSGGMVLKQMVEEWLEDYVTVTECRIDFLKEVAEEGGIRVKLIPNQLSKEGNYYTKVIVI